MTRLLLSEVFPPRTGGSGRWFWEIYRRMPRDGYAIAAGQTPNQRAFDATHDLRVHRLPLTLTAWGLRSWNGLSGYWRAYCGLARLVRSEKVQMIHCGRCLPEGVMSLALKWRFGIPYLCYVHGEDVTTALDSREYAWLVRRVLGNAKFLIANSHNTREILRTQWGMAPEKVCLLHPGVDTNYFTPAPPDPEMRARLGWTGRKVVLTVGRLQKRKGHDMMIRALGAIRAVHPDVLYAIAGDGEERAPLTSLSSELGVTGQVQFLGEIGDKELLSCYQQCDLFSLPNRQVGRDVEGFGMVLLEAQACGKPVLAGTSGGTAETMQVGQTGRVTSCDEPAPLAAEVIDLLSDIALREQMGQAARVWVVDQFDWDALRKQAERLFDIGPAGMATPVPQPAGAP